MMAHSLTHIGIILVIYLYHEWTKKEIKQLKERIEQLEDETKDSNG